MIELVGKRQENSKTFKLDSRKNQLVVSIGAIHYKDDYADRSELWKDIDLTWERNKITKAPYELTRKGNKLTIRDKKSGKVSTIELMGDVGLDTDLEVIPEYSRVKFTRILKSNKAPVEAKFKVTGKIPFRVRASDADGDLPVVSSLKDGILAESLGLADRAIKYPIRIDPTWQVGISSDDCYRRLGSDFWGLADVGQSAGAVSGSFYQYGGGMRFTNITIPGDAIITEAHLTLRAKNNESSVNCNTRISAEDVDDAPTFADSAGAFDTRWANRTAARMDWDNIGAWTTGTDYDSPSTDGATTFASIIQEIIDRGGWNSGQDIVIFWDDFEDRTSHSDHIRYARSYDFDTTNVPRLVITYTLPSVPVGGSPLAQMIQAGLV